MSYKIIITQFLIIVTKKTNVYISDSVFFSFNIAIFGTLLYLKGIFAQISLSKHTIAYQLLDLKYLFLKA